MRYINVGALVSLSVVLLSISLPAHAYNSSIVNGLDQGVNNFKTVLDGVNKTALMPSGLAIVGVLAGFGLLWNGVKIVIEGGVFTHALGNIIRTIMLAGLATAFITNTDKLHLFTIVQQITSAAACELQGIGANCKPSDVGLNTIDHVFKVIDAIDRLIGRIFQVDSVWDGIKMLGTFFALLIPISILLVATFILLGSCLLFLVMFLASQVLLAVSAILAPLLVPFVILEATSFLFQGWLKFTIGAGMYTVVGNAILFAASQAIIMTFDNMIAQNRNTLNDSTVEVLLTDATALFAMSIITALFGLMIFYLMKQLPQIATGIVSGSAGTNMQLAARSVQKAAIGDGKKDKDGNVNRGVAGRGAGAMASFGKTGMAAVANYAGNKLREKGHALNKTYGGGNKQKSALLQRNYGNTMINAGNMLKYASRGRMDQLKNNAEHTARHAGNSIRSARDSLQRAKFYNGT